MDMGKEKPLTGGRLWLSSSFPRAVPFPEVFSKFTLFAKVCQPANPFQTGHFKWRGIILCQNGAQMGISRTVDYSARIKPAGPVVCGSTARLAGKAGRRVLATYSQ